MLRDENVDKLYNIIDLLGEKSVLLEWVIYSSNDEIKEFVEHCEQMFELEV